MAHAGMELKEAVTAAQPSKTLRVDGVFDVSAALKLREAIAQLPSSEEVLLDFSRTKECHDFALAALVHAIATMNRTRVMTRGLSSHQHRLLKYLGDSQLS